MEKPQVVIVKDLSNAEFLETYAKPGCVGLAGGPTLVDKAIRRAQRRQRPDRTWSDWGHAFFFQGRRQDGQHWVMESDLDIQSRNIRLGVQENRISKYYDASEFDTLAVMDFNLTEAQVHQLICAGLDLMAVNTQYSLREIFGTFLALHHIGSRERTVKLLNRDRSLFCSAFVQHLFSKIDIDFAPDVAEKHTTPEDIAQTPIPHTFYWLRRDVPKKQKKSKLVLLNL
ncbi:MAG: hypothetical protein K1Y36_08025 [Blastocatellia bacterium]|nr:hypothetical protein [Blastocatellia bacterium]